MRVEDRESRIEDLFACVVANVIDRLGKWWEEGFVPNMIIAPS